MNKKKEFVEGIDYVITIRKRKKFIKNPKKNICPICENCNHKNLCLNRRNKETMERCNKCKNCSDCDNCDKFHFYNEYEGRLLKLGINVELNKELEKDFTLEDLENEYDAIFLSFGKNVSSKMGIEGEDLQGVYGGNELLEYRNFPNFKGKKVAIIGGRKCCYGCFKNHKTLRRRKCYCYRCFNYNKKQCED